MDNFEQAQMMQENLQLKAQNEEIRKQNKQIRAQNAKTYLISKSLSQALDKAVDELEAVCIYTEGDFDEETQKGLEKFVSGLRTIDEEAKIKAFELYHELALDGVFCIECSHNKNNRFDEVPREDCPECGIKDAFFQGFYVYKKREPESAPSAVALQYLKQSQQMLVSGKLEEQVALKDAISVYLKHLDEQQEGETK